MPMPGSPPSRITPPGTRPPPSTRSNSSMPVGKARRLRWHRRWRARRTALGLAGERSGSARTPVSRSSRPACSIRRIAGTGPAIWALAAAFGAGVDGLGLGHVRRAAYGHVASSSGVHDRGAELADDDARRLIGDAHRDRRISAPAPSSAPSVAITVSPAPETSNTSRATRRNVLRAGLRGVEAHALLRARDEQRVDAELGAQRLRLGRHVAPRRASGRRPARNSARLGVIIVAPRYSVQSSPLGSTSTGLPAARAPLDHRRDVREPALAVIGEHDHVGVGAAARSKSASLPASTSCDGAVSKSMRKQLLLAADDAQLDRGRQRGVAMKRACARRPPRAAARDVAPASSAPMTDSSVARRAERRRIARDVRRAARALLAARDLDHRHRAPRAKCARRRRTSSGRA